jgi:hypothetical protein
MNDDVPNRKVAEARKPSEENAGRCHPERSEGSLQSLANH